MAESIKKNALLLLIGLSAVIYLPVFQPSFDALSIGQYLGFVGIQLIWWQVVLGSRVISRYFSSDLFFIKNVHKYMGRYGFILVMLHPTVLLLTYGTQLIIPSFDFSDQFVLGTTMGRIGLSFLILTWFVSLFLRTKISWRNWKRIHLVPYIALPILFYHSFLVGTHLQTSAFFKNMIIFLIATFAIVALIRLVDWSGEYKLKYKLVKKTSVANNVTKYDFVPLGSRITPTPGQFAYQQMKRFGETHPFTISHFDEDTGQISQSIKSVGPYTKALAEIKIGSTVYFEGPYGVFTEEITAKARPIVMVAGGIGITPFVRWLQAKKVDYLFYGAQNEDDLAFQKTISTSGAKILGVLSGERKSGYENGYVTSELIEKNLSKDLKSYDYYICGPPPMMDKITSNLLAKKVPAEQIHSERFSL